MDKDEQLYQNLVKIANSLTSTSAFQIIVTTKLKISNSTFLGAIQL